MAHAGIGATISAILLVGLLVGQVAVLAVLAKRSKVSVTKTALAVLLLTAVGGALFQVLHAIEHVGQLANWVAYPTQKPWLSPWAMPAAMGLDRLGPPGTGMELLHLIGNLIFFFGVVTLAILVRVCVASIKAVRTTKLTLWVQGLHVVEHVALTGSVMLTGRSFGVSTFFGMVSGPPLFTYRIWWHFVVNLIGTILFVKALWELRPAVVPARARTMPLPGWATAPPPGVSATPGRRLRDLAAVARFGPAAFAFQLVRVPREATAAAVPGALDLALARVAPRAGEHSFAPGGGVSDVEQGPIGQGAADAAPRRWNRTRVLAMGRRAAALIAVVATVILAVHVALVLLGANENNAMVSFFSATASGIAVGFKDVFDYPDPRMHALANYGLAALLYFVVWRVLTRRDRSVRS